MANFLNALKETGGTSATRKLRLHVVKRLHEMGFYLEILPMADCPVLCLKSWLIWKLKMTNKQKPQVHVTPEINV